MNASRNDPLAFASAVMRSSRVTPSAPGQSIRDGNSLETLALNQSRHFLAIVYACACSGIPLGRKQVKKILAIALLAATPLVAVAQEPQGGTAEPHGTPSTGSSASSSHHVRGIIISAAKTRITGYRNTILRSNTARRSSRHRARKFRARCHQIILQVQNGEPGGSPFCRLRFVVRRAPQCNASFADDAHRMRGVISECLALSPVESYTSFRGSTSSQLGSTLVQRTIQAK